MDKKTIPIKESPIIILFFYFIFFTFGVFWQRYYGVHQLMLNLGIRTIEYSDLSSRQQVPFEKLKKPLVLLIAGQSNVANSVAVLSDSTLPIYNFYEGNLYQAKDPLLGATGNLGSIWIKTASTLLNEQNEYHSIVLINVARSNTSIDDWIDDGKYRSLIANTYSLAVQRGLYPNIIIWGQGERDAIDGMSHKKYKNKLERFVLSIQEHISQIPMLVSISSACFNSPPNKPITKAQKSIISHYEGVFFGPNTDFFGANFRYDGCHFNELGKNTMANLWSESIKQLLLGSKPINNDLKQ